MAETTATKRFMVRFSDGTEIGPLDKQAIRSMARGGRLKPDDLIGQPGGDKWLVASQIPGLFESTSTPQNDGIIPLAEPVAYSQSSRSTAMRSGENGGSPRRKPSSSGTKGLLLLLAVLGLVAAGIWSGLKLGKHGPPRASSQAATSQPTPTDPVASFKKFVQCFSQQTDAMNKRHSATSVVFEITGTDLKKTDSLISPIVGEITAEFFRLDGKYAGTLTCEQDAQGGWSVTKLGARLVERADGTPNLDAALEDLQDHLNEIDPGKCK